MYTSQILIISFFNTHFDSKPRKHSLKAGMSHLFLKCSGKYTCIYFKILELPVIDNFFHFHWSPQEEITRDPECNRYLLFNAT